MPVQEFDVFLSHNSDDRLAVEQIAKMLMAQGIRPWLDAWELIPGAPWQDAIEIGLASSGSCAVFVGSRGIAPWQNAEMRAAIDRRIRADSVGFRVVPVLLPEASSAGQGNELPAFLRAATWVKFVGGLDDEQAMHALICGITGRHPGPPEQGLKAIEHSVRWVLVLSANYDELNAPRIDAIVDHLRTLCGDMSLTKKRVGRGSVEILFEGSRSSYEHVQELSTVGC